ncbi:hypothetical protein CL55_00004890 [Polynucleobacter duraquae]|jgi:hypothetical protein|uniref:Uncharacterized protein n=1 Tax=Polynucleobacter duraquae TaxID=1835254 RepID=A0A0E3ZLB5_9BURK|nr:hypothetical protein [Polynucleobacter duraquae]AKD24822.1 hypothetical protein CL55_00004890 [Polynucleobacter duraquae]
MTSTKDPYRNDVFEDEYGHRVAVKRLYTPNELGVSYVEYKNYDDSALRFMPKEQFMEVFHWVDNFGTTDTFVRIDEPAEAPKEAAKDKEPDPSASPKGGESSQQQVADGAPPKRIS